MKGLKYQLKSVLRDKFCLMTFLLPILVAVALNFMGSIDLSAWANCISAYWKMICHCRQLHGWSGMVR